MHLRAHVSELLDVVAANGVWMMWNTVLAWIPVMIAFVLFRPWDEAPPPRRSAIWWVGLVLFVLFLPNAPYVVTDLVHLREDVILAGPTGRVVTTVMPVYGLLVVSGFLAYYLALAQLRQYLDRIGWSHRTGRIVLGLHALVAVGIFLGRWSRLNSWEPVVRPQDAVDRVLIAFTWSAAPMLIVVMFLTTAFGHFATKAIAEAAWAKVKPLLDEQDQQVRS